MQQFVYQIGQGNKLAKRGEKDMMGNKKQQ
jgi:hypothetical protein